MFTQSFCTIRRPNISPPKVRYFRGISQKCLGISRTFPGKILEMSRLISQKNSLTFPEMSGKCPGNVLEMFPEMSGTFPGNFRDISGQFLGIFREISGKFLGNFPGHFREISGKSGSQARNRHIWTWRSCFFIRFSGKRQF